MIFCGDQSDGHDAILALGRALVAGGDEDLPLTGRQVRKRLFVVQGGFDLGRDNALSGGGKPNGFQELILGS